MQSLPWITKNLQSAFLRRSCVSLYFFRLQGGLLCNVNIKEKLDAKGICMKVGRIG